MIDLFLLYLLTGPSLVVLIVFSLILEFNEQHATVAFIVGVIALVSWKLFNVSHSAMLWGVVLYIPVGLFWTVWRWRIHCKESVRKANEHYHTRNSSSDWSPSKFTQDGVKRLLDPKQNSDKLISWVLCWPVSVVERTLGDIVHVIRIMVTEWFGSVFDKISKSAMSDLKPIDIPSKDITNNY